MARTALSTPSRDGDSTRGLAREYPVAKETGSFARMENELDKQFYAEVILKSAGGMPEAGSSLALSGWILILKIS